MATIATHNGSSVAREHNIRNRNVTDKEKHIDKNGTYEIWKDEKPREAYKRIFGSALKEYNEKQTREDRVIKDYYNHIEKDKNKKPVYEMIVGIYNEPDVPEETKKEIMKQFVNEWQERNPDLILIGAYYHNDELGEAHCHIDYIPVASGYQRGLAIQNGLVKALGQMGFEKQGKLTAQIQWEKRENQYLEKLCNQRGITVEHPQLEGVKHLETENYKLVKENERLQGLNREYEELKLDTVDKTIFGKPKVTVSLQYEDFQTLKNLAAQTQNIEAREQKLEAREEELNQKEKNLNYKMIALKSIERDISDKQRKITDMLENLENTVIQKAKQLNSDILDFVKENNLFQKWKERKEYKELQDSLKREKEKLNRSLSDGSLTIEQQLSIADRVSKLEEKLKHSGKSKPEPEKENELFWDDISL